ncbi:MAG: hypothetical protein RMX65_020210 [Nostoc sp. DedQUE01]|nr:hypothetical protein [Nostoc sp. SerVER01]MDZ8074073.1 hypothetical protein [Nostoc sp. DedQUE01]MDZ8077546.1 hypothetical protein [Nostoc sp. DcaGUA01]
MQLIDISNGEIVHWLHLDGIAEELFDVVVQLGVVAPQAQYS